MLSTPGNDLNDVHFNIITLHYEETEVDKQLGEGFHRTRKARLLRLLP